MGGRLSISTFLGSADDCIIPVSPAEENGAGPSKELKFTLSSYSEPKPAMPPSCLDKHSPLQDVEAQLSHTYCN